MIDDDDVMFRSSLKYPWPLVFSISTVADKMRWLNETEIISSYTYSEGISTQCQTYKSLSASDTTNEPLVTTTCLSPSTRSALLTKERQSVSQSVSQIHSKPIDSIRKYTCNVDYRSIVV